MKKNKRLFICILSFLLVITFSFNTYNIKRVDASVTAVSSAVLVSNPEILIPVLGVGAVAGGAYITKKAYDNYFKPWAIDKISSLAQSKILEYFQIKVNTQTGDNYVVPTSSGLDFISNSLTEFNDNTIVVEKEYISTIDSLYEPFVDSEGYYFEAKKIISSQYKDVNVLIPPIHLSAGSILWMKAFVYPYNTCPSSQIISGGFQAPADCLVKLITVGDNNPSFRYQRVQPYVSYDDGLTWSWDVGSCLGTTMLYGEAVTIMPGYKIDGFSGVEIPSSAVIGSNVIDLSQVRADDLGVKIEPEPDGDEDGKYKPMIPWLGTSELILGDGVKTDSDDFVVGESKPDIGGKPDIDNNVDSSPSSSLLTEILDSIKGIPKAVADIFIPSKTDIIDIWDDYISNIEDKFSVPTGINIQADAVKPPLVYYFRVLGVNLCLDLRFIDTPKILNLIHTLVAGLLLFLLSWYNYKKIYSIIRGVAPVEGNMGQTGNYYPSGLQMELPSSDVKLLGGRK